MKKIIGIAAISLFAASMMFGQSALKNLSGAINSAKKAAESAKQVADCKHPASSPPASFLRKSKQEADCKCLDCSQYISWHREY